VERAQEYRRLSERLRSLSERANLPETRAELLWLAQSYQRLAWESADGFLVDGHLAHERPVIVNPGRAVPD
jgi:hypothetical protein